jgi:hypothetical protein
MTKMKMTASQIWLLKEFGTIVVTSSGSTYYFLPYWFKTTEHKGLYEVLFLDGQLPDDIVEAINDKRNLPYGDKAVEMQSPPEEPKRTITIGAILKPADSPNGIIKVQLDAKSMVIDNSGTKIIGPCRIKELFTSQFTLDEFIIWDIDKNFYPYVIYIKSPDIEMDINKAIVPGFVGVIYN